MSLASVDTVAPMSTPGFEHRPVMVEQVVETLRPVPPGVLVDANVGGAGHATALLDAHPGLTLVGFDRDRDAVEAARRRLDPYGGRAEVHHRSFEAMTEVLESHGLADQVTAVLFDLGLSSPQVDRAERGFSYHLDAPLDMRFDPSHGPSAADLLARVDEAELTRILRDNADERYAARIARAVIAARPVTSTGRLAEVVAGAVPAPARRRGHPARRTFQALRMEVNEELPRLDTALTRAVDLLRPTGRLAVLTYHSGEDRMVKATLRQGATGGCTCPPGLPCACGAEPTLDLLRPTSRTPSETELEQNPRARSARLRAAVKRPTADDPSSHPQGARP